MRAHELEPYVVMAAAAAPAHQTKGDVWWDGVTLDDLLAEPPPRSPPWLSCVAARMAVASTGPVLVADEGPGSQRLEAAGWLRVAEDADYNAARHAAWPALVKCRELKIGAGSLAPKLVIVGDRDPHDRLPFFARSGVWLFRALRELGWDELTIYACNSYTPQGRSMAEELKVLYHTFAPYDPTWLATGAAAAEVMRGAGVEHLYCEHPAKSRRFEFNAGPVGYAQKLRNAKLPLGPWRPNSIFVADAEGYPPLYLGGGDGAATLASSLGMPLSVAYRAEGSTGARTRAAGDPVKVEQARTLYVTGAEKNVRAAAKAIGLSPQIAQREAREQDWESERASYLEQVRTQAKAKASEAEAKAIRQSRQLVWGVLMKSLMKLNRQADTEDNPVRAQDVKALGDLAINLKELGDPTGDAERERLSGLKPDELVKELNATVMGMFGIGPTGAAPGAAS